MVWENLPRVMENPADLEARSSMMMASMMGAIAFQKGLGAAHSLAHPLSTEFGMHHGTANAVVLPAVLEYNRTVAAGRLATLAAQFGRTDAVECVHELNRVAGIPSRLRDCGIPETALPMLADRAVEDGCHQLNPRACTRDDLLELYRRAY
jgi:alcohol dehydrogenase class IV